MNQKYINKKVSLQICKDEICIPLGNYKRKEILIAGTVFIGMLIVLRQLNKN